VQQTKRKLFRGLFNSHDNHRFCSSSAPTLFRNHRVTRVFQKPTTALPQMRRLELRRSKRHQRRLKLRATSSRNSDGSTRSAKKIILWSSFSSDGFGSRRIHNRNSCNPPDRFPRLLPPGSFPGVNDLSGEFPLAVVVVRYLILPLLLCDQIRLEVLM
jgi:hypothetical protein